MKIIGFLLILEALFLGYFGVTTILESTNSIQVLNVDIGISNGDKKMDGYIFSGLALINFIGGLALVLRKR